MLRANEREKAINSKLVELRDLRKMRADVDKSIGELKESYGNLTNRIDKVKAEIRLLGGKVPVGSEYNDSMMLGNLIDGRRLRDERP